MSYPTGNAPCSWGVEFGDDPRNPPWEKVLDEARAAGYRGMELGPLGFMPENPEVLGEALGKRGLTLTAGVLFRPFHDPNALPEIIDAAHRTCRSLKAQGAEQLVLIDSISERRVPTAGRPAEAERLVGADLAAFHRRVREVCEIATGDYGMTVSLHAHAAGFIEFEDEIHRTMDAFAPELLGLCIDTGHCEYACTDPVKLYHQYHERVPYVHYKDVDPVIREKVVKERIGFYDACGMGLFCNLGDGVVDFAGFKAAMDEHGFSGWGTVEQDCDPTAGNPVLADARHNLEFLTSVGIAAADGRGAA
ncbi:MAG: myo-inositol catabolism protein [Gammaproteobacteria bacterium]|nr:MAG: myo-inositol catabolism protein [Gammaproteobacteria bacterium]